MNKTAFSMLATSCLFTLTMITQADVLSEQELNKRIAVFGDGFLLGKIEAPVIANPNAWIGRKSGDYVYIFTQGSDNGATTQTEKHIPDPSDPEKSWERHIGDQTIETFVSAENEDLLIVQELDQQHGYRMEIKPGVHWPANASVGDQWVVDAELAVYEVPSNDFYKNGKLVSTITYEGAYRVHTPAGDFDTVLIREDFLLHIGPLKADDDRFMFFAREVGLVAEIEGIRASAMIVVHIKQDSAKVLQSYPGKL